MARLPDEPTFRRQDFDTEATLVMAERQRQRDVTDAAPASAEQAAEQPTGQDKNLALRTQLFTVMVDTIEGFDPQSLNDPEKKREAQEVLRRVLRQTAAGFGAGVGAGQGLDASAGTLTDFDAPAEPAADFDAELREAASNADVDADEMRRDLGAVSKKGILVPGKDLGVPFFDKTLSPSRELLIASRLNEEADKANQRDGETRKVRRLRDTQSEEIKDFVGIVIHHTPGPSSVSRDRLKLQRPTSNSYHFLVDNNTGAITQILSLNSRPSQIKPSGHEMREVPGKIFRSFSNNNTISIAISGIGFGDGRSPRESEIALRSIEKLVRLLVRSFPTIDDVRGHGEIQHDRQVKEGLVGAIRGRIAAGFPEKPGGTVNTTLGSN